MELIINTKGWHSSQSCKFNFTCLFKAKFLLCNTSSKITRACLVTKHFADEGNVEHSCSYMPGAVTQWIQWFKFLNIQVLGQMFLNNKEKNKLNQIFKESQRDWIWDYIHK